MIEDDSAPSTPVDVIHTQQSFKNMVHRCFMPLPASTWRPPINLDTLKELTADHIFNDILVRHNLLFDAKLEYRPNLSGASGNEKRKRTHNFWKQVRHAFEFALVHDSGNRFDFLKDIFHEIVLILVSLRSPFASLPPLTQPLRWNWPTHITEYDIRNALDPETLVQLLCQDDIQKFTQHFHCLYDILASIQPATEVGRFNMMVHYFCDMKYTRALRQCFSLLEATRLDCANRILQAYRPLLIDTCASVEAAHFRKRMRSRHPLERRRLESTMAWLMHSLRRLVGPDKKEFLDVYYSGLVSLVAENTDMQCVLGYPLVSFPTTFEFDERRLLRDFHDKFQNIVLLSMLMLPYFHLVGAHWRKADALLLKLRLMDFLKNPMIALASTPQDEEGNEWRYISCLGLAQLACHTAADTRRHCGQTALLANGKMEAMISFWGRWLSTHLKPTSDVYHLVHQRTRCMIEGYSRDGNAKIPQIVHGCGLADDVISLGLKLKVLADLNLKVFGSYYDYLFKAVISRDGSVS